jgi:hypothetical protein
VENVSDTILLLDDQGVVQYANPSTQRMLGYHPSEMIGRNFADLFDGDRQVLLRHFHDFLQEGKDVSSSSRFACATGRVSALVEGITRTCWPSRASNAVLSNLLRHFSTARVSTGPAAQLDELKALHRTSASVAATDVAGEDQLITQVTEIFSQNFYPDHFGVLLLDEHSGRRRCILLNREKQGNSCATWRWGWHYRNVVKNGTPCRLADVSIEPAYLVGEPDTPRELCVPLKVAILSWG